MTFCSVISAASTRTTPAAPIAVSSGSKDTPEVRSSSGHVRRKVAIGTPSEPGSDGATTSVPPGGGSAAWCADAMNAGTKRLRS
eukprot:2461354-Prymnesium_polylepis.1